MRQPFGERRRAVRADELENLVDEMLYLVEVGDGSSLADERELAHVLDRLALAMRHGVAPAEHLHESCREHWGREGTLPAGTRGGA